MPQRDSQSVQLTKATTIRALIQMSKTITNKKKVILYCCICFYVIRELFVCMRVCVGQNSP